MTEMYLRNAAKDLTEYTSANRSKALHLLVTAKLHAIPRHGFLSTTHKSE
jgi:hypothetical protein